MRDHIKMLTDFRGPLEILDGRAEVIFVLIVEPAQLLQSFGVILVVLQSLHVGILCVIDLCALASARQCAEQICGEDRSVAVQPTGRPNLAKNTGKQVTLDFYTR